MSEVNIPWSEKEILAGQSETLTIGPFKRSINLHRLLIMPSEDHILVQVSMDGEPLQGSKASDFGGAFGTKIQAVRGKTLKIVATNESSLPVLFKVAMFASLSVEREDLCLDAPESNKEE